MFEVLLTAYLAIRYLGLKSIFRLGALFLAFIGLVLVPSGILLSAASGQHYPNANGVTNLTTNNSTLRWANTFNGQCENGESSLGSRTTYLGLDYSGSSSTLSGTCYGTGQLASEAYASGLYGRASIQTSIWWKDKQFYVPNIRQQSSLVYVGGIIHATGWLADHTAGIGIYQSDTTLNAIVKIVGTAPCNIDNTCYGENYFVAQTWTGFQTFNNDITFSGLMFLVAPGYYYNIIVSFNETSNVFGAGAGGIANSDACFGYTSYCSSSPDIGPTLVCSPSPSSQPCGLAIKQLYYTLTNV
jgi:hypothetical protein